MPYYPMRSQSRTEPTCLACRRTTPGVVRWDARGHRSTKRAWGVPVQMALATTWLYVPANTHKRKRLGGTGTGRDSSAPRRRRRRRRLISAASDDRISRMGRPLAGLARTQALDSGFLSLDDRSRKGRLWKPARPPDLSRGHRSFQRDLARTRLLSLHTSEASARSRCVPASGGVVPICGFECGAGASIGAKASSGAEGGRVLRKRRTSSTIRTPPE